jgi:hypothetical protein
MEKFINCMTTSPNTHGGKREGAGRPSQGIKRMTFCISEQAQAILATIDKKSEFINDLIIKATR